VDVDFKPDHSVSFTSLTMTPAVYLARLVDRVVRLGGRIHRARLHSLDDIASLQVQAMIGSLPRSVILCVGLGARTLGGVEDAEVFPTRGQVVKIKAPWIREGFTRQVGSLNGAEGGERTYVIPRPDGEVIIGGTREIDDWEPYPREETKVDIMRRAGEICSFLNPAHVEPGPQGVSDITLTHLVGFRPSRKGGVRLEKEMKGGLEVVYNYGHGGAGWQSCWGCAEDAVEMVLAGLSFETANL
jgi:glycine/D-amino acid oxidase-like deaminating enzyme